MTLRGAFPLLAFAVWVGVPAAAPGQERASNFFGQDRGLAAPPVWALAQDSAGFLWVGAEGGLFRFDGAEMRRWDPARLATFVMDVAVAPDGAVAALAGDGRLFDVVGDRVVEGALPWPRRDAPRRPGRMLAFDEDGRLWLRYGDEIGVREETAWRTLDASVFAGEVPRGVLPAASTGVFVNTDDGLWRVNADGEASRVYVVDRNAGEVVVAAHEPDPGRVLVLLNVGREHRPRVVEATGGRVGERVSAASLPRSRAIALRERNGTVWLALDTYLVASRRGETPELLGPGAGFESGGPLLVDREGSLWLGSYVGLHQYPEPDTRIWAEAEGLPSRHTRFVSRSGDVVWVMTWSGPGRLRRTVDGWTADSVPWDSRSAICTSADGSAWTGSEETVLRLIGDRVVSWPGLPVHVQGCAPAPDGGMWLGSSEAVVYLNGDRGEQRRFAVPLPDEVLDPRPALLHDREGRLWVAAGPSLCHAPVEPLPAGGELSWACREVAGARGVLAMVELEDGRLWASLGPLGLAEFDGAEWAPLAVPGAPTQTVHALVPSPRGGVWIAGDGALARGSPGAGGRVEILEQLTAWHGLAASSASHVYEERRGDLWIATNRGLVQVPSEVRFGAPGPPPVALVEARVDQERMPLTGALVLPHDRNRLELRFAALSYRNRGGLHHQVRLSPDAPWVAAPDIPSVRWVDLPPGRYQAEYRASRDGHSWSTLPAAFGFTVEPPWYATWWFLLMAAGAAVGLAALIYRTRVAHLVGLEQQRTRIALDLHDQVGSGLASVGILSGVMAADESASAEGRRTAVEIASVAEELGHSLSDIVWALDPHTTGLEELAARLVEHGERLFADDRSLFEARLPDRWPPLPSSMAVRRNVLLIGLEALHNAARHAGAGRVTLSLAPSGGAWWTLAVVDDGAGGAEGGARRGGPRGRGIDGMARRAREIGGALEVRSPPGGGTTVILRFPLHDSPIRVRRFMARMIMRGRNGR